MADVIIIPDFQEGHIYPTFKLAQNLINNGISVCFLGTADVMEHASKQGFENFIILEDIYPKGHSKQMYNQGQSDPHTSLNHFSSLLSDKLNLILKQLKPKIIFFSYFISLEALLVYYKYRIPQFIYHTYFPPNFDYSDTSLSKHTSNACIENIMEYYGNIADDLLEFIRNQGVTFDSMIDLVAPFKDMPQIMLCPNELSIEKLNICENDIYIGPCIRDASFSEIKLCEKYISSLKENRKLIFASMGSQTKVYFKKAQKVFKLIIDSMKHTCMENFHLILSVGSESFNYEFGEVPNNVTIYNWIPQVEIIKHVSLAITHGGLGTIKECIYNGIPMIIIPMGRDQMDNAMRVKHHNLGYVADAKLITTEEMANMIIELDDSDSIANSLNNMMTIFHQKETDQEETLLVKKIINR